MQMPNQAYVYSPDGTDEGWYYENKIPEGWVRQKPEPESEEEEPEAPEHTQGLTDVQDDLEDDEDDE